MPILRYFTSCMSRSKAPLVDNSGKCSIENDKLEVFYTNEIPESIKELLVYISREGVAVVDLFRRPGNTVHIKRVMGQLKRGESIDWCKYNFYTLANVAKRYLLQIDGGIIGGEAERELIGCLELTDDQSRLESMTCTLQALSPDVKRLLALLFGTWFRMIYHSEVNTMSVEAVAKSVAGSVFPSCTVNPQQVNKASKVMEYLITGFASSELFGASLIEYFTTATQTSISRIEKFKYEFVYPKNVPKKKSTRLFVRMLLEESSIHGFDLLRDEVTEAAFNEVDSGASVASVGPEADTAAGESREVRPRKRRLSKTMTCPAVPAAGRAQEHQVQQTSEKKTCVTASASDDLGGLTASPAVVSRKTARLDLRPDGDEQQHCLMDAVIKAELRRLQLDTATQTVPEVAGGRFSCVKLQQLQRLQKRSDWFLSPPVGCRSQTLLPWHCSSSLHCHGLGLGLQHTANEGRPMSAKVSPTPAGTDGPGDDRLATSVAGTAARLPPSPPTSLSDPTLFKSCHGGDGLPGDEDEDEDEVEVRYFVVHKFYGPGTGATRPEE